LSNEDVVGATFSDERGGMCALDVDGVGGDDRPDQVYGRVRHSFLSILLLTAAEPDGG
jgi:hypothetical protein